MKQYFIKIKQESSKLSYGTLLFNKNKRVTLEYLKKDNEKLFSNPIKVMDWIKNKINQQKTTDCKIVFFIHGLLGSRPMILSRNSKVFNNSYFKCEEIVIIHIIWNNGKILYRKNLKSLEGSKSTFASVLNAINLSFIDTSVICQSMGNRFFFDTILTEKVKVHFKEILLIAPDISINKFKTHYTKALLLTNKIYIFYHLNDRVLKHSSRINKVDRLGRISLNLANNNIEFIECSSQEIRKFPDNILNHMYFLTSETIKAKINSIL